MLTDSFLARSAGLKAAVSRSRPDAAFALRPRLLALRDALAATRTPTSRRARWGEPPVFFFDPARQAEYEAARPPVAPPAATPLEELVGEVLPTLLASVEVRRLARAIPGLREGCERLASTVPAVHSLADALAIVDDETVLVLHPGRRTGVRVLVQSMAEVARFHELLPAAFEGPFQFFKPSAVQPDGSLPIGFRGCDHWLWPREPFAAVPRVDGERVILLGDPAYAATGTVERHFSSSPAVVEMIQELNPFIVAERLSRFAGRPVPVAIESSEVMQVKAA